MKTIKVELNNYKSIPYKLVDPRDSSKTLEEISFNLKTLFHHYYLDSYDDVVPTPNPLQSLNSKFLEKCRDFRFIASKTGKSTGARRNRSYEYGQAFCRMFLSEYSNITHFAHMDEVLDKSCMWKVQIKRSSKGDVPDYLCVDSSKVTFIAEAKGSYTKISFTNKKFDKWRNQFDRIEVVHKSGRLVSLKGYIVATQYATTDRQEMQSKIWAEDPKTRGSLQQHEIESDLWENVIRIHYSKILVKINQPIIANALLNHDQYDSDYYNMMIWEVIDGPLKGKRFIGGLIYLDEFNCSFILDYLLDPNPYLNIGRSVFFGLSDRIFKSCISLLHNKSDEMNVYDFIYKKNIKEDNTYSLLEDGTLIAETKLMRLIGKI